VRHTIAEGWQTVSLFSVQSVISIAWGRGIFVIVGGSGTVYTTPDTNLISAAGVRSTVSLQGVVAGNDTFVTVGQDGVIFTSLDGVGWRNSTP
jgi:hypothetical protein